MCRAALKLLLMRTLRHCQCSVDQSSIAPLSLATATIVPSLVAARAVTAVGRQSIKRARWRATSASDDAGSGCLRLPDSPGIFFASLYSRRSARRAGSRTDQRTIYLLLQRFNAAISVLIDDSDFIASETAVAHNELSERLSRTKKKRMPCANSRASQCRA